MSRGPWSIKGIDSRARERAREKAQRSGLTLGEYLNHLLIEEDSSEFGDQQRYGADHVVADRYSDVIAEVGISGRNYDAMRFFAFCLWGPRSAAPVRAPSPRSSAKRYGR